MGLSHFALPVGDFYEEMRDFYKAVLASLGYEFKFEAQGPTGAYYCAFGQENKGPDFWLGGSGPSLKKYDGKMENRTAPVHFAFDADSQKQVDEWHEAAM